jgi:hypothetical protein
VISIGTKHDSPITKKRGGKEMKKVIVLGLLIMAFSATVYAQPKIDFRGSGSLEIVSVWHENVAPGDGAITTFWAGPGAFAPPGGYWDKNFGDPAASGALNRDQAFMETRGILRFDASMGKEVSATFIFELDSSRWGERGGTRGALGAWNADVAGIEVKNMYLDVALPYFGIPAPMTVRAGIQPFGVRPHIFAYTDGAGITGAIKLDPALIALYWAKAIEGRDADADDVDIYGINVNAKLGTVTPGFYVFNYNMNTYPLGAFQSVYGITPTAESNMWWLGFYLDGKLGPVNINFDVVADYGSVKDRANAVPAVLERKVKYRGGAGQLKIDFPWEKFNFGVLGMYATGADLQKTTRFGLPSNSVEDPAGLGVTRKVSSYVIPPGSEEWAVWGESMILGNNFITATALPQGMWPALGQPGGVGYANQMSRGAIGGTWVAKLYASMKATPWYKVTLQGLYIGDTTKHGNTLGDARKSTGGLRNDKTIGWEFDLINEIQIYNNLKWSIGAGYLFAGDALDQLGAFGNIEPHNPWIIATKLRYDF